MTAGNRSTVAWPRVSALVVSVVLAALALASCTDGDSNPEPRADPTTTTSVEDAVVDAYLRFWETFFSAADPPDPDHPGLAEVATGDQLTRLRDLFAERRADGVANRPGSTRQRPQVVEVSGERATVADCWLDEAVLVDVATGEVISDRKVWTEGEFQLVREDGTWKVTSNTIDEREENRPCEG